jgi:hypothetical protein
MARAALASRSRRATGTRSMRNAAPPFGRASTVTRASARPAAWSSASSRAPRSRSAWVLVTPRRGLSLAARANEGSGLTGTISLVGGGAPGATPANWALPPGSVGIGNASDGGDRGVDANAPEGGLNARAAGSSSR